MVPGDTFSCRGRNAGLRSFISKAALPLRLRIKRNKRTSKLLSRNMYSILYGRRQGLMRRPLLICRPRAWGRLDMASDVIHALHHRGGGIRQSVDFGGEWLKGKRPFITRRAHAPNLSYIVEQVAPIDENAVRIT